VLHRPSELADVTFHVGTMRNISDFSTNQDSWITSALLVIHSESDLRQNQ
jgi:hypothetical protein